MPETLALVRALQDGHSDGCSDSIATALGSPPDITEVKSLGVDDRIPRRWGEVYGRSLALPADAVAAWHPAVQLCSSRWGEPNANGAVLPLPVASSVPHDSR